MIRKFEEKDIVEYKKMSAEFYSSDAVLHNIPSCYIDAFIEEALKSDEYCGCYMIESGGELAGYAVTAKTFSQEAGGIVLWLEELYIKEKFRGKGLGSEFFAYILKTPKVKRFRLEYEKDNLRAEKLYKKLGFSELPYRQMIFEK